MHFKIDENLPIEATALFQNAGYDAMSVFEQKLVGAADHDLAAVCQNEGRIIITLDLDFADIRTYPPQNYPGLIVLRLKHQDKYTVLGVLERLIKALAVESPEQKLWIVNENRIRIRK
jgi:predicted nuclease of predicted toxin-antitoxin system